ncbi:hypothetical protein DFH08DRAFT_980125 [Mycena albidolilacea]|uniref:Uncharacterized protein n=1 Tax=Mycena albidolilacea TaxID=1033008 RepID=A0AAD7ATJ3_9AGAR|nr:hypothetical protein DFH08DRAFT_980125 [Mycena albidolilacea]
MAPIFYVILSLCIASCALAAPMQRRQTGNLECNLARLKIVTDVADAKVLVGQINTTLVRPSESDSSVAVVQAGLNSVDEAIRTILDEVLSGGTAPESSREQVDDGLSTANQALGLITDPSLNATVTTAQAKIANAGDDGASVVANCK